MQPETIEHTIVNIAEPAEREARRLDMYAMRDAGCTLQTIAHKYSISRERVRQIIKSYPRKVEPKPTPEMRAQRRTMNQMVNFWNRVKVGAPDDCWPWLASKCPAGGYGHISITLGSTRYQTAHRAMYAIIHGGIPEGKYILHTCDNPSCVNPDHLYAGTAKDNAMDRASRGRSGRHLRGAEIKEIRATAGKVKIADLAAKFGVSYTTVLNVLNQKTHRQSLGLPLYMFKITQPELL